jgi:hypothetical protein
LGLAKARCDTHVILNRIEFLVYGLGLTRKHGKHARSTAGTETASWTFSSEHSINTSAFCFVIGFWKILEHLYIQISQLWFTAAWSHLLVLGVS